MAAGLFMRELKTDGAARVELSVVVSDDAGGPDSAAVSAGLARDIDAAFGPADARQLSIVLRDGEDLVGGLNGVIHWRWLYIRHFWIAPAWRGAGHGRTLLARAETEARARNCAGVYLDTFDPGAARFYQACGFVPCGDIPDFPPGHARLFLRKPL
jgi:GNAT superfamily N-acetyltransferase